MYFKLPADKKFTLTVQLSFMAFERMRKKSLKRTQAVFFESVIPEETSEANHYTSTDNPDDNQRK